MSEVRKIEGKWEKLREINTNFEKIQENWKTIKIKNIPKNSRWIYKTSEWIKKQTKKFVLNPFNWVELRELRRIQVHSKDFSESLKNQENLKEYNIIMGVNII